jgi:hypothetical protein
MSYKAPRKKMAVCEDLEISLLVQLKAAKIYSHLPGVPYFI